MAARAGESLEIRQVPSAVSLGVVEGNAFKLDAQDANDIRTSAAKTEVHFRFGLPGDKVLFGNWDGKGPGPVAVRQPGVNGAPVDGLVHWYMDTDGDLVADRHFAFGLAGDTPVVGDWDGNGRDDVGVTRPAGAAGVANDGLLNWFLGNSSSPTTFSHRQYGFASDTPVVGNWDGRGGDDVGIVRTDAAGNLTWMQDRNGDKLPDRIFNFGRVGDQPVTGDWDGNGTDNVGVARITGGNSLQWLLDTNGNSTPDVVRRLTTTGTTPMVVEKVQVATTGTSPGSTAVATAGSLGRLLRPNITSGIDLRPGQLSNGTSSVPVSGSLQNGETIVIWAPETRYHVKTFKSDDLAHQIGRRDGTSWSVNVTDTPNRYLAYGPYFTLQQGGKYSADFELGIDNNTADNGHILTIDVVDADTGTVLDSKQIRRKDFKLTGSLEKFTLNFDAVAGHRIELRTYWHGGAYVRQGAVGLYRSASQR